MSLLHLDPLPDGTPAVTVHRLVQAVARARAENNGTALAAAARFTTRLAAIYPAGAHFNLASWPFCAQLTPHVLAQYQRGTGPKSDSAQSAELLERVGLYFLGRAAYLGADILFRAVIATRESTLGP